MTTPDVKIEALKLVPDQWREDFLTFIENGEARPEFLAALNGSKAMQRACDVVLRGDSLGLILRQACNPDADPR